MQVVEHMGEPFQWVDADDVAAFEQRVVDGVVDGSAVAFAEQVVFAAHYRGALGTFYRIVVNVVASIQGLAP